MARQLFNIIGNNWIEASAPCRIDCGGVWDIKGLALLGESIQPITVTLALDMRVKVRITPLESSVVRIRCNNVQEQEFELKDVAFNKTFGMFFAILSHFDVEGVEVNIESIFPPQSGLGGSGAAAVAMIAALSKAVDNGKHRQSSGAQIAILAHNIEDGLRFTYTGLQDQLAAVFGGVHKWT